MKNFHKSIPFISLGIASILVFAFAQFTQNLQLKNILFSVFSNAIFFFVAYLFYNLIRESILIKERRYLDYYIKNNIANDIFVALYFLKKIIYGYNLESNTLKNILEIVNNSEKEIKNSISNQSYLGFQVFKKTDEVRSLFGNVLTDNLILKYSSHIDTISILRISNNLARLEILLKSESNFNKSAETGIEYMVINGKDMNDDNDDKQLLTKKTPHPNRYVVYDSGFFEDDKKDLLLNRYTLKDSASKEVSVLLYETLSLMKHWLPDTIQLSKNESRFRVIKEFFSANTNTNAKKSKIFVADIVEMGKSR